MVQFFRRTFAKPEQPPQVAPADIGELLRRAVLSHQHGKLSEAEALYGQVLAVAPANFDALHLLGVVQYQKGEHEAAAEFIRRAIAADGNRAAAHSNLGLALHALRQYDDALASYEAALALHSNYFDALLNRGKTLRELQRTDEALVSYDRALVVDPANVIGLATRGNALFDLKRFAEALKDYDRALALQPDNAIVLNNRGNALVELRRAEDALRDYDSALALKPDYVDAMLNRGNALRALLQPEEALASYDAAFALQPTFVEALLNRANALQDMGRYDDALATYGHALTIRSDFASAHHNEALCRLLLGDFAAGWRKYEWRWRDVQLEPFRRDFRGPLWLGESAIAGKTILLHSEQGLGDTLQFVRYAIDLAKRGATVVLEAPPMLVPLLVRAEGVSQLVARGEPVPRFDYHCPLLSLPLAFETGIDSIPAQIPYLHSEPERVAAWGHRLASANRPRVGLVWSGGVSHKNDANRSIVLKDFVRLLIDGAHYVSLQKGVRPADQALLRERADVQHLGDALADFADTAALIESLDMVVAVDTAVAHLAGAMGKPVWILLPFNPDWRWLLKRDDTPWYPTARLFRQAKAGDWEPVIARVATALREWLNRTPL